MSSSAHSTSSGENVSMRASSSASCGRSETFRGLISMAAFLCELDEVPGQIRVTDAGRRRRFCEAGLRVKVTVRVDVDDERLPVAIDAQVDAAVVAAVERGPRLERGLDAAALEARRQRRGLRRAV